MIGSRNEVLICYRKLQCIHINKIIFWCQSAWCEKCKQYHFQGIMNISEPSWLRKSMITHIMVYSTTQPSSEIFVALCRWKLILLSGINISSMIFIISLQLLYVLQRLCMPVKHTICGILCYCWSLDSHVYLFDLFPDLYPFFCSYRFIRLIFTQILCPQCI